MLFEGCQGNKGTQLQEKLCPNCGDTVELFSTDVFTQCEACGTVIYADGMDCVRRCEKARECVGDYTYARLQEALANEKAALLENDDSDEW